MISWVVTELAKISVSVPSIYKDVLDLLHPAAYSLLLICICNVENIESDFPHFFHLNAMNPFYLNSQT